MNITWSQKSEKQLDQIYDYIAQDSPLYASSTVLQIIERAEKVTQQPFQGRIVPEYKNDLIREVFVHPYRIIYEVQTNRINIITVVHEARLMPKKL